MTFQSPKAVPSAVLETLNDVNLNLSLGQAVLVDDVVQFRHMLPAEGLSISQIDAALTLMVEASDAFDDLLADRFGGSTFLPNDKDEMDV